MNEVMNSLSQASLKNSSNSRSRKSKGERNPGLVSFGMGISMNKAPSRVHIEKLKHRKILETFVFPHIMTYIVLYG